jgi:hypothetical protein
MMRPETLKRLLDAEWQRPGVRFPGRLARWSELGAGHKSKLTGLYFAPGKKTPAPKPRARR